jgi:hypothetical protein
MSCTSFLRKLGLLSPRKETDDERLAAVTENAMIDNERAFAQMHEAYSKVPETNQLLRETIQRSTTPFSDLETFMHGDNNNRRAPN